MSKETRKLRSEFQEFLPALECGVIASIFVADPTNQVGIDACQKGIQCRGIEFPVVLHPPRNDRVDHPGQFSKGVIDLAL